VLATTLALLGLASMPTSQALAGPVPVELVQIPLGPGGFQSANISYEGTLAFESPAVGARVVQLGAQKRLYVTTTKGLSVYDVTNPGLPLLLGTTAFYNWENEDIAVSADGRWVLSSEFSAILYTHVFEAITQPGGVVTFVPRATVPLQADHTISCVDSACDWAYGSEGGIWDLRNKSNPDVVGQWGSGGHDVTVDSAGLVWTDTDPITALDVTDPRNPLIVAQSTGTEGGTVQYQHNNLRPFAADYKPRVTPEELADPNYRPGEILLGEGETNATVRCGGGNGPFVTYDLRNVKFDNPNGAKFRIAEVFKPVSGTYTNGDPAVNAMGCSGHWFDVSPLSTHDKITTSNAWYDHGTRILAINGKTAKISQVGFFQPVVGAASASYWIDDEYIYTVDYERGIDILKFDPTVEVPTEAQFTASWMAKAHAAKSVLGQIEQYACRQAVLSTR
jgi:hypothetical protein